MEKKQKRGGKRELKSIEDRKKTVVRKKKKKTIAIEEKTN